MNAFQQLREAIAATLDIPPEMVRETTTQKDLAKWDSLAHVNLMVALESTFDLMLEVEDFEKLTSVPAILEHLKRHGIE